MSKKLISTLILSTLILVGCGQSKPKASATPTPIPPTPTPAETQLPENQRPVVTMTPDAKIQRVSLKITNLPKDVTEVDYELIYLSDGTERGSIGTYYTTKTKNEVALGSCSSGVCNYDKNITNGTLTLTYTTNGQDILLRYPFNPVAPE